MASGVKLLGAVEALLESMAGVLGSEDQVAYERAVVAAREMLGEEAFERAWEEGRGLSLEEAVALALGRTKDE
jgi:hypothetical protein